MADASISYGNSDPSCVGVDVCPPVVICELSGVWAPASVLTPGM
jgi:hypothetical protein